MNFQGLQSVDTPDFYLDVAIKRMKKRISETREQKLRGSPMMRSKTIEIIKIEMLESELREMLYKVLKSFPSVDSLPEFYRELIDITLDTGMMKKSLGAVKWCIEKNHDFLGRYKQAIKMATEIPRINSYRREFFGRISSTMKQIKQNLAYLEHSRRIMVEYPNVKTGLTTVAIAGFPNIGKTTLLSKLTGSTPKIASYAFTTQGINIGNAIINEQKVQFLDTPGTLNRFEKQNQIEKVASLALKYVTDIIVYVFDLTEPYSLKDQKELYEELKSLRRPILIYLSKTDIIENEKVDAFKKQYKDAFTNPEDIKKAIKNNL